MSERDIVLDKLRSAKDDLAHRYAVSKLALFGSVGRNEDKEQSDVDLLVSFNRIPDLLTFLQLEEELSALLGKRVDLVPERKLKESLRKSIHEEAIAV